MAARALTAFALAAALACGREEARDAAASSAPAARASEAPAPAETPRAARSSLPAGEFRLAVANGVVSIDAAEAPRRPLLEALAERAGFALEIAPGELPPISLLIEAEPLEAALPRLVGDRDYRTEWVDEDGAHRLAKLFVGKARPGDASADASALRPGEVSEALHRALAELADESTPMSEEEALRRLSDADPEARLRAVLALEGEGEGLGALIRTIESDPDPRVRAAATVGLEESEDFAAVQALVAALDDPNAEVVVEAIDSLEFAGDASVVASLKPLLSHADPRVRKAAADAIQLLGD